MAAEVHPLLTRNGTQRAVRARTVARSVGANPYIAFMVRWSWLLVIGLVAGIGAAYQYSLYGPIPLRSTAVILVPSQSDPSTNPQGSPLQARNAAESFAVQASTAHLYGLVSEALKGKLDVSSRDLLEMDQAKKIDIRAPRDSNLITISVTETSPATAQLLADTIAQVFVNDVNARAGEDLDTRRKQLSDRIELTRRQLTAAQLYQRQQDLTKAMSDERSQFAQLQLQYIQELQHEVELDRLELTGEQRQSIQAVRTQWLDITSNQQQAIRSRLNELGDQLAAVQADLDTLPERTDPVISAAFAGAYSGQLQALTQQFVQLQINSQAATSVLVRYGTASPAIPADSTRKLLAYGAAGGLLAALVLAGLLEVPRRWWLRRRERARRNRGSPQPGVPVPFNEHPSE